MRRKVTLESATYSQLAGHAPLPRRSSSPIPDMTAIRNIVDDEWRQFLNIDRNQVGLVFRAMYFEAVAVLGYRPTKSSRCDPSLPESRTNNPHSDMMTCASGLFMLVCCDGSPDSPELRKVANILLAHAPRLRDTAIVPGVDRKTS
ncbi:hypothetical protein SDRG_03680 [Saprolegnia diclina VS20]|uniref:Uncharacterized protein n=1 Tax=Saprolegnia diclina (strain VS20) TaxID=1156394 RepID=T0QXC9_SAPDV|nr:hypothetical protein SDRG_03680 [Saprolegnia diclina VS20]EQC38715.1 hypothetical protein SDRG_03680 [Saprolegnia diclina VS20]|eukprot:XP_008607539.1 hypothetical protein SDRG_03680 [Saprolegnia diclina VS20]